MSNPSLQEQLQALVSTSGPTGTRKSPEDPAHRKNSARKTASPKPAWLEYVFYGVELLKAHYPQCFKEPSEVKPLKVGIKQDLVKHLSTRDDIIISDKTCMIKSLSYYVTTLHYFKNVIEGALRVDLDGNSAGVVTCEEGRYSAEQHKAKLQKKTARSAARHSAASKTPR